MIAPIEKPDHYSRLTDPTDPRRNDRMTRTPDSASGLWPAAERCIELHPSAVVIASITVGLLLGWAVKRKFR